MVRAVKDLAIRTEYIHLDQALKLAGLAASGGEAQAAVRGGSVSVNGATETRRGRKLRPGDVIEFNGIVMRIVWKTCNRVGVDNLCRADSDGRNQERTDGGHVGKSDRAD